MSAAWYRVMSLLFGYLSAGILFAIIFLGARQYVSDRALWRRVAKNLPRAGAAGTLRVMSAGSRRLSAGQEIRVPYEGTLGASHGCDICIPKVHLRSAFFWMDKDRLHMVALHRDGFEADGVTVEPGDEAVLEDGAVLRIGETKLVLRLNGAQRHRHEADVGPYVTSARRSRVQKGKGEGLGAPGRAEMRREKKLAAGLEDRRNEKKNSGKNGRDAGEPVGKPMKKTEKAARKTERR